MVESGPTRSSWSRSDRSLHSATQKLRRFSKTMRRSGSAMNSMARSHSAALLHGSTCNIRPGSPHLATVCIAQPRRASRRNGSCGLKALLTGQPFEGCARRWTRPLTRERSWHNLAEYHPSDCDRDEKYRQQVKPPSEARFHDGHHMTRGSRLKMARKSKSEMPTRSFPKSPMCGPVVWFRVIVTQPLLIFY
jgi:hypothetical protein